MAKEELGSVSDLFENFNGNRGSFVVLEGETPEEVDRQLKSIKQGVSVIGYAIKGRKYTLALLVAGKVKKKIVKRKSKILGE